MTHRRAVAGGVLVTVAACVVAWALAYPAGPLGPALVRAVADAAAVVTLGLVVVPLLDGPRYREELSRRAWMPLVMSSATWVVAEVVRLAIAAAAAAGTGATSLGLRTAVDFATRTAPGRAGMLTILAAALVCAVAVLRVRSVPAAVASAGAAAVGIIGHPLTGHLAESPLGGVAIAGHALAAAVWCGVLAAVVLTVDHRGQWARILPRFSRLSLGCVAALLAGGVIGGVAALTAPSDLYATGYGRVLTAKIVLTAVLLVLAWRNRRIWLPAARTHRSSAVVSRTRAYVEVALMAAALAAAATLSVTG